MVIRVGVISYVVALALVSSSSTATGFSRISSSTRTRHPPPRWISIRGGADIQTTTAQTSTSLQSSLIGAIDTFYKTMPLASAFLTCGVKAGLADLVAQKRAISKQIAAETTDDETDTIILGDIETTPLEFKRNIAFVLYGGLYQGICQEIIFNEVFPIFFGNGNDIQTVLSKVLCDSLVVTPFVCLPIAYVVKSIIFQYSFAEAISRYRYDVINNGLLVKYWSLWGPVQCLTFGVIPQHFRIVWIAVVSFFWLIIFSSITAKGQKDSEHLDDSCNLEDGVSCRIDG